MEPRKNKDKNNVGSKPTSKQVDSGKKRLKNGKKGGIGTESTSEEVVSGTKIVEDKKAVDGKESVSTSTPVVKKKPSWLKLDRISSQTGNKSSVESSEQGKEEKVSAQVQDLKDGKRKRNGKDEERGENERNSYEKHTESHHEQKERRIVNDRREDRKNRDEEADKRIGGLIFMCNAKTKPDCFGYKVMGVPINKKEVVMSIEPGLKLFLYDYDLKLMYGVYEASSSGGMKLEPAAFGGGFPAQVRFVVHKDCLPLPESMFKKAIKDSYDERTRKFKTELTVKQVKHLIDFFTPTPRLHQNSQSIVQERNPISYPSPAPPPMSEESLERQRYINSFGPSDQNGSHNTDQLFLTEQEYRNNGLRQGRHLLPASAGDGANQIWERLKLDQELRQFLRDPPSTSTGLAVQPREANQVDPLSLSEKEYRLYGLRAPQQISTRASPALTTSNISRDSRICDPYDEVTASLVNRYLPVPMATALPPESSYHPNHHRSDVESYPRMINPDGERTSYSLREQSVFNQRPYSLGGSREPSVFNQSFGHLGETELASAPVSSRYSFAGPSPAQHR